MAEHMLAQSGLPSPELENFFSSKAEEGVLIYHLEYKSFKHHPFVHA